MSLQRYIEQFRGDGATETFLLYKRPNPSRYELEFVGEFGDVSAARQFAEQRDNRHYTPASGYGEHYLFEQEAQYIGVFTPYAYLIKRKGAQ